MKCKCKKNQLLSTQDICWQCYGKLSLEKQRELISNPKERPPEHKTYDPRSKRINQVDKVDTLQQWKKIDGKIVENKDFMEKYGTEQMHSYEKERAEFYEKKGYVKNKRTVVNDTPTT